MSPPSRRALLRSLGAGLAAGVAGCESRPGTDSPTPVGTNLPDRSSTSTPRVDRCDDPWGPSECWRFRTGIGAYAPTVVDGVVYFAAQNEVLYALDAADGAVRWRRERAVQLYSRPVVEDGTVVVAGYEALQAFDAASGDEGWSFAPPGEHAEVVDGPFVDDSRAYCTVRNRAGPQEEPAETPYSRLYAVNLDSGEPTWYREFGEFTGPAVSVGPADHLAVTASEGQFLWLDGATGETAWRHQFDDAIGGPVTTGSTVAVPLLSGGLAAVDPIAERVLWRREGAFDEYLAARAGSIYALRRSELVAIDGSTGRFRWRSALPRDVEANPRLGVADGTVYYTLPGDDAAAKVAVDAATGCRLGRFEVPARSASRVAVHDGTVYLGGLHGEGAMYAVSAPPRHET
jgi:outer membrane protein assembly factor BamB